MLTLPQLAILATHSVLTEQASPLGYLLLRTLRRFNLVDMYAALEVQTDETISWGLQALKEYGELLKASLTGAKDKLL